MLRTREQARLSPIDVNPFRTAAGLKLIAAWERWRGRRLLPVESDIEPDDIASIVPQLMLLEYRGWDEVTFRWTGGQISEGLGQSLEGSNYLDLARSDVRAHRAERMARQMAQPCGACMVNIHRVETGILMPVEVVSLPVAPDRDDLPPLIIAVAAPSFSEMRMEGSSPQNLRERATEYFCFDIGAGLPEPVPDDFVAPEQGG
ncbi:MAG TPA: PAS domain-containing protein [Alphaproteobacteria bacterium]|nr:PAS domain-containing protein [Alphaproteobacteria bacterium]